VPTTGVEPVT